MFRVELGNKVLYCNPDSGLVFVELLLPCSKSLASFALAWKYRIELRKVPCHSLVSQVDKRLQPFWQHRRMLGLKHLVVMRPARRVWRLVDYLAVKVYRILVLDSMPSLFCPSSASFSSFCSSLALGSAALMSQSSHKTPESTVQDPVWSLSFWIRRTSSSGGLVLSLAWQAPYT